MNFEDKLTKQLLNFSVKVPNQPKHLKHHYADYVELIALFSNENSFTYVDLIDRLQDEGTVLYQDIDTTLDDEIGSYAAQIDDKQEIWSKSVFDILYHRHLLFAENYPFVVHHTYRIELKPKSVITDKHKLYLSLLVSSNLNTFHKTIRSELTSEFETISYHALKHYLPEFAEIRQFGKNSDYTGTATNKIKNLAEDMKIEIKEKGLANIAAGNVQERGLDIIGWLPFEDGIPNIIVFLAQCACGKNWYSKQLETRRYENYLDFYAQKPLHTMFIPYGITTSESRFYQDDELSNTLVFSRKRILEFNKQIEYFRELNSHIAVNNFIDYEEDIV